MPRISVLNFLCTRQRRRDFKNLALQFRKVAHDNFPYRFEIDAKVLVHQDIPKPTTSDHSSSGCAFRKSPDRPRQASPIIWK
jgi:hypothetical protein